MACRTVYVLPNITLTIKINCGWITPDKFTSFPRQVCLLNHWIKDLFSRHVISCNIWTVSFFTVKFNGLYREMNGPLAWEILASVYMCVSMGISSDALQVSMNLCMHWFKHLSWSLVFKYANHMRWLALMQCYEWVIPVGAIMQLCNTLYTSGCIVLLISDV